MTDNDLRKILEQAITERNDKHGKGGAAKVAIILGMSQSQLSWFRKGTYPNPEPILEKIREVFGQEVIFCPEIGAIPFADCAAHKKRLPTTDSFYARMYRACKCCPNNGGKP
ncbi:hypothetical protein KI809_15535 [Geobacter pelophilus]|uniref:HTH cro/C1-type domain-containing protein n=1 Tax=Geoanaerobacter pelophilus TaxID=60036 RepID=A0AAW4LBE9_9BACT|nr:hypothetical protein [Geoanaerobacter pelophilus]MBT0665721.1 hypothetical protein [Geoanaerobacter pelophilus]